jgi:hypothetical protein
MPAVKPIADSSKRERFTLILTSSIIPNHCAKASARTLRMRVEGAPGFGLQADLWRGRDGPAATRFRLNQLAER